MFSGIIEKKSKIIEIDNWRFIVENTFQDTIKVGQSIAHDGACMTLESIDANTYTFFCMEESFKKTNFLNKKKGDFFNIERSLQVGDRIDGHFVSGHIDTTGKIQDIKTHEDSSITIEVTFSEDFSKFVIEKWSITINGVSLTVVGTWSWFLSVCIIPHTQKETNLWNLKIHDIVNLEFDMLWKYLYNLKKYVTI